MVRLLEMQLNYEKKKTMRGSLESAKFQKGMKNQIG